MFQITICGDGPIAHSLAAICGWRGHAVRVLADNASVWRDRLVGQLPDRSALVGGIAIVTAEASIALADTDLVLVCVPHANIESMLHRISPHIREGMVIGAVPGFGGFGLLARKLIRTRSCFFGTQRIPFVVSRYEPGRSVRIGGVRRQTFVGTMPADRARSVAALMEEILGVRTVPISHYLNVELSPSNSIVNPARLYALFGPAARRPPRIGEEFFLDWNITASRVLLALDRELQQGRTILPRDTSFVAPILLQYDANDSNTLTDRFRGLTSLAARRIPARQVRGVVTIDPRTHYLSEDIDIGLTIVRDVLRMAGAQTPRMDEILNWRKSLLTTRELEIWSSRGSPAQAFGTIESLVKALD